MYHSRSLSLPTLSHWAWEVNDLWVSGGNCTSPFLCGDSVPSTELVYPFGLLFPVIGLGRASKPCSPLPGALPFSTSVRRGGQGKKEAILWASSNIQAPQTCVTLVIYPISRDLQFPIFKVRIISTHGMRYRD